MRERTRDWPIRSVLVANRGEIALRILRTVHECGLEGAVIYHALDRHSPAVGRADHAIEIRGSTPVAAYLDAQQIIAAAMRSGAQAIHPGYGFLSENAAFARAVEKEGLIFIGPTPEQIELMGDKVRSRAYVASRDFPIAPSEIEEGDPAAFLERAHLLGPPLLIKPAAGGGGKGMRIVRDLQQLPAELERARSEAKRYFGDPRLYVERFVEDPHHIEVQVLGDAYGQLVHLFERDCSVQRRFQKIIEESPAPTLDPIVRERICETAAGIARSVKYRNAGTVEFVFGRGEFYFLEMNTRLQVEHPVTEQTTGRDLVFEQIRLAAGEPLGYSQKDVGAKGHAIELRICAEDPARGYAPATGRLMKLREPTGEGVRVDSGVQERQEVTAAFDPLLAKLIVHGHDREQAIGRARRALEEYVMLGCKTNVSFLRRLLDRPEFLQARIHTNYLDGHPGLAAEPAIDEATVRRLLAAAALTTRTLREPADLTPALHAALGPWRN